MEEGSVAQPLRRRAEAPVKASRLAPVPPPMDAVNGMESARDLLTRLERLAKKGGTFTQDPEKRPYVFYGGQHLSVSQVIEDNLWKFEFNSMARNILDHMKAVHDDQGLVEVTQCELAVKYGVSQSKVSRGIGELSRHNFTWKEQRGVYRLNPLYAYRWGSVKQRRLVKALETVLLEHEIVIPTVRNEATR
ncbi:hypothetical protein [Streptomyces antimicrobicus]|uniref:Plasmid replication protein RepL domain-containing protein n=1 Tax=Streptomyces antimicrobicus TaxID=2883108 RepID=A0ABS8BB85_9ACTN|nr:hypothetical protein [Streptomyces antimicrobicus]MCB5181892.1 hypothetical protein [Streptomyces antimicrobicus]